MKHHTLTTKQISAYTQFLRQEERAYATIEKYSRDIHAFAGWLKKRPVTKQTVTQWKEQLLADNVSPATINAKLSTCQRPVSLSGLEGTESNPSRCKSEHSGRHPVT